MRDLKQLKDEFSDLIEVYHKNLQSAFFAALTISIGTLLLFWILMLIMGHIEPGWLFYIHAAGVGLFVIAGIINFFCYGKIKANIKLSRDLFLKQTEELAAFKGQFENMLDSVSDYVIVFNYDMAYIYSNEANTRNFIRKDSEAILGKHVLEVLPQFAGSSFYNTMERVVKERIPEVVEDKYIFDDNSRGWFQCRIFPIPAGIMVIATDITGRKESEEALKQSESQYKMLFEKIPDPLFVIHKQQVVVANSATLRFFDVQSLEMLTSKPISEYIRISSDDLARIREIYKSALEGVDSAVHETRIALENGEVFDMEFYLCSFSYNGEAAVQVIMWDASFRNKLEETRRMLAEALEYDRVRTAFFSNISHELRTPLNVIQGAIQLYEVYEKAGNTAAFDFARYYRIMKQNSSRLLRLINNIIDMTRIDARSMELDMKDCNIVSIVEDISNAVGDFIRDKGFTVEFDTEAEEIIVSCDVEKIERIMLNLLSNAVKYSGENREVFVNISLVNQYTRIAVRDKGVGISEENQKMVFERFRQVDATLTRSTEGSGIGLSLVKSLVEMHGGTVSVSSKPEGGSEFAFTIPTVLDGQQRLTDTSYKTDRGIDRIIVEFSDVFNVN